MANTSVVYARIDSDLKDKAESILAKLGITPTSAVQMFYSQIVLHNGIPFELKIPIEAPVVIGPLNREQLDTELLNGFYSLKNKKTYTAAEIDEEFGKALE